MRIARFIDGDGETRLGSDQGDGAAELLEGRLFGELRPTGRSAPIVRRLAPLEPANILCIGANYRQHARECSVPIPERPIIFMKPTSALNGPNDPIRIPACQMQGPEVDYECELAVVIGTAALNVPVDRALDHVYGYMAANDVSARRWQKEGGASQWIRGKGFDTFCPLGPVLVTADEIPDPQALKLSTTIDGQVLQSNTTGDMIFTVAELISFMSQDTTLLPGTVILTGTPEGVGMARKPSRWLKAGDTVIVEVEKIGRLENPVVDA